MSDSQRAMAARVVRVLACLISVWGIMLLIDDVGENDGFGYVFLVLGPAFMLSARWVDSPKDSDESPSEASDKASDTKEPVAAEAGNDDSE